MSNALVSPEWTDTAERQICLWEPKTIFLFALVRQIALSQWISLVCLLLQILQPLESHQQTCDIYDSMKDTLQLWYLSFDELL